MNEADFQEPEYEAMFFGDNYPALMSVKQKYDPESFFYATKGVNSEAWEIAEDGRMCKA